MRFPGFIGASYRARSVNVDCQRCINLYPEVTESQNGKEREVMSLVQTPGLSLFCDLGEVARGQWTESKSGRTFAVAGSKVWEIHANKTKTEVGTIATNFGPVSFADNGVMVALVDGERMYTITLATSAFNQVTDPDLISKPKQIICINLMFLVINDEKVQGSGRLSTEFDEFDFVTSEGSPDKIVAIMNDHDDVWVFNEYTTEVLQDNGGGIDPNSGTAIFPYARAPGAFLEVGCAAPFSVAKMNNSVFWLGRDKLGAGMVYMAQGYTPQRISTHAIEWAIQQYSNLEDARAYCYQMDGHHFYVLNFTDANTTWVYDSSTGLWHERTYLNQGEIERHRSETHVFAFGKHLVSDYKNGKIYEMSANIFTDDEVAIRRVRRTPHASAGGANIFFSSLLIDMETGTGLDGIQQGVDPQAMLRWSDDGGHTWKGEQWRSFGRIGQRKARVKFSRLGRSRDRVFELSFSEPVRISLIGADLDVTTGAA